MLDPGFTTSEMTRVFSATNRVAAMMRFEAALALALTDAGVLDPATGEAVAEACRSPIEEPDAVLAATWAEGTPLNPLLDEIRARVTDEEADWVHHGATTQDAIDTATMLLAEEGLGILDAGLLTVAGLMAGLVRHHRDQPQMGRTFLQHARPTTFGMTVAGWLEPTLVHISELQELGSGLVVQLGGPVGNLSPYGQHGLAVMEALAVRLGLATPTLPWHTDRTRIAALAATLERCARTMARVGLDIALLASSDIAEIAVRSGGSSSMTEKRNPIDSIRAVAAAELCSAASGMITGGRLPELDRGIGGWHAEWVALPLVFQSAAAAVEAMTDCLGSLEVDVERMTERAGEAPELDPALIDRVLSDHDAVAGDT
jgi:3-carboxy-cis,cis-muconate cycloisomerase